MAAKKKKINVRAARKRAAQPPLAAALAEAGWREADLNLAQAMVYADDAEAAAAKGDADTLNEALLLLVQSLNTAARRRGLARFGGVGARTKFEAKRHALAGAAKPTKTVRIAAPGIERGGEVLIKARVKPVRVRKRS